MKLIKQVVIGFVGIASVVFLLSLPLPSRLNVSKSVLVNLPAATVMESLGNLQEWPHWNPLLQDTAATYKYDGNNKVSWNAADGKTNSIELQLYATDSLYITIATNGKPAFNAGFNVLSNTDGGKFTKVDWWIQEDLGWMPWEKFYGLFSESLKETYLENSLYSLKVYLEKSK